MLFTEYAFVLVMVLLAPANFLLRTFPVTQKVFLLTVSLLFFASFGLSALWLFLGVAFVNYWLTLFIGRATTDHVKRSLLLLTVIIDVGALGLFKYADFVAAELLGLSPDLVVSLLPWKASWRPLALSFYTFHMLSYAVDIRQSKYLPAKPLDYALYLSFFPHLIAGPIVRGNQLIPQLVTPRRAYDFDIRSGLYSYSLGLLLKVCADRIASLIDPYWLPDAHTHLTAGGHWLVAVLYSTQIYGDFAGYSLMAVGVARCLGYGLPDNFNAPYLAATFQAFWRRWHMTLSAFLRDYLYIYTLGGSRLGDRRTYLNIMITMGLGGLWHGASWNFLIWGIIHGSALVLEKLLGMEQRRPWPAVAVWWLMVQAVVVIAWVFFRAPTLATAGSFVGSMMGPVANGTLDPSLRYAPLLALPAVIQHLAGLPMVRTGWTTHWALQGAVVGVTAMLAILLFDYPATFIYFNF